MSGSSNKGLLDHAVTLFEKTDYTESIELFSNLFQRPRIRMSAAEKYLDLFLEHVANERLYGIVPLEAAQLALEILNRRRNRIEALRRQSRLASVLIQSPYGSILRNTNQLPELTRILTSYGGGGTGGDDPPVGEGEEDQPRSGKGGPTPGVRRTPHMDILPNEISPNAVLDIDVYTDTFATREGEESDDVQLPPGKAEYDLRVALLVPEGFTILTKNWQPLKIVAAVDRSDPASFKVQAPAALEPDYRPSFTAIFSYEGKPSGKVTRQVGSAKETPGMDATQVLETGRADLIVRVVEPPDSKGAKYECFVQTPLVPGYFTEVRGDWSPPSAAPELIKSYMDTFTDDGVDARGRYAALKSAGRQLFRAAPDVFQKAYWAMVDANHPPRSILVSSEEHSFPWELMIPERDGDEDRHLPLGVTCAMGRWTRHDSPQVKIQLTNAYVVAPDYGDPSEQLQGAEDEVKRVLSCFVGANDSDWRIRPADITTIDDRVGSNPVTLFHFIGHGTAAVQGAPSSSVDQFVYLDNKKPLSALTVEGLDGFRSMCKKRHPIIFMNACEVGRQTAALYGTGGFAAAFIKMGASAVIATIWSVESELAFEIAADFYGRLQHDRALSIGEFFQEIRKKAYDKDAIEDTYAAYCFYGDPLAKLTL